MRLPHRQVDQAPLAHPIDGPRIGRVRTFERGVVWVEHDGHVSPVRARVSAALDDAALADAARYRQDALLLFEEGDPLRPVVVALLRSATPALDALLVPPKRLRTARIEASRVLVEGEEEITLRCGKSSLTFRSDGTVVLRGVNVVTQADQVHKIRGGKVQIN